MRLIDAAVKDLEMIGDCRTCGNKTPFCDSNPDSCIGYKWRGVPPDATDDNQPLTLEELLEMDGEPVWVETTDIKKANRWAFVDVSCEIVRFFDTRCGVKCTVMGNHFRTYGKTWLAYRRKPEEGTT